MQYTPFGEYFRVLRIKNREILMNAKEFLGVSTAYISAVECGNKPIPDEWIPKIIQHYNLDEKEQVELQTAVDNSRKNLKLNLSNASTAKQQMAISLGRSFDEMDDETARKIFDLLKRTK